MMETAAETMTKTRALEEDDRHLIVERLAEHLEATVPDSDRLPPGDSGAYRLPPIDDVKYFCGRCDHSYAGSVRCPRCGDESRLPYTPSDEYEKDEFADGLQKQYEMAAARARPHRDAIARLLDLARPRVSLLTVVCEAILRELGAARGRAHDLGCCWYADECRFSKSGETHCHHCACGGLDDDEDRSLHIDGARERAYREALAQVKLLPELIVHMARVHIGVDLSDVDDDELRRSTEPRLAELRDEITRAANHERWKRN